MITDFLSDIDFDPSVRTKLINEVLDQQGLEMHSWSQNKLENILGSIDNLPHALLIDGSEGVGKLNFAEHLISHWLLSNLGNAEAMMASIDRQHADLHVITAPYHFHNKLKPWFKNHALSYFNETQLNAKKPSQVISIDQVRQFCQNIQLHALNAPYKIGLIYPIDRLNTYAANALLKTLEEPAGDTKLILCADNLANVPETIRSRCMRISISNPTANEAKQWLNGQFTNLDQDGVSLILKLVHNAPLLAKEMIEADIVEKLQVYLADLIMMVENKKNPLAIAQEWVSSINNVNYGVSLIYQWLMVLFFDTYHRGIEQSSQSTSGAALNSEKGSEIDLASQDYNQLISELLANYALLHKEIPFESYRQLYLKSQNGIRLAKTATDQTLFLEQLLMKLYKLNA